MPPSINDLPNEVIQQIVRQLDARCIPSIQLVCRRFNGLVDQLTWRHFCRTRFRYWREEHQIAARFVAAVNETNWKDLYIRRHLIDVSTTVTLNSILSSQMGRIEKFQQIIDYGYDAKDCLLRHYRIAEEADDVLARRYYSDAILGCLHRIMAIEEWTKLQKRTNIPLERALSAFDMFILQDREGDFDDVSTRLDEVANSIRTETVNLHLMTTRQKAILVSEYLCTNNLTGFQEERNYHDLRNAFLGLALYSKDHSSLPLISTAIFACVSRRLGINAAACSFPFHVVAIVKPPAGFDLDGNIASSASPMYLDPFTAGGELPVEALIERLEQIQVSSNYEDFLSASPIEEIVLRNGRNIRSSVRESHRHTMARQTVGATSGQVAGTHFPDLEGSFYGALWASLLLGISPDGDGPMLSVRRRNYLSHIIEHFETHFPTDVSLIEKYILPLFRNTGEYAQLRESVRVTRSVDSMPKDVKHRSQEISQRVKYRIGQVFIHKRYHYHAVITGWDVECGADEHWMLRMRVHELSRGKQQSFYHVLVEDKTVRYVAEENIQPVSPEIPYSLMSLAGRHFKRWDMTTRCFVSNIRDEYPDD